MKPLLDAYANRFESEDDWELLASSWREVEERHVVARLVDRWRKAWVPVQKSNGYWDPPGVMWLAAKDWLDARLVDQHGGYAPGARVRLSDGRPALVYAVEWGEDGPHGRLPSPRAGTGHARQCGPPGASLTSDLLVKAVDTGPLND